MRCLYIVPGINSGKLKQRGGKHTTTLCLSAFALILAVVHIPNVALADAPTLTDLVSKAQQGNAAAEYELAHRYRIGDGFPQSYADAVEWYRKAADQGYAPAEARLGGMYLAGLGGLPKDENEGRIWLSKAASQGDASAKFELELYDNAFIRWVRSFPQAMKDAAFFGLLALALLLIVGVVVVGVKLVARAAKHLLRLQ